MQKRKTTRETALVLQHKKKELAANLALANSFFVKRRSFRLAIQKTSFPHRSLVAWMRPQHVRKAGLLDHRAAAVLPLTPPACSCIPVPKLLVVLGEPSRYSNDNLKALFTIALVLFFGGTLRLWKPAAKSMRLTKQNQ